MRPLRHRLTATIAAVGTGGLLWSAHHHGLRALPASAHLSPQRTVEGVVGSKQAAVERSLSKSFARGGLRWPARRLALLALKAERRFEVWGRADGGWVPLKAYPILAASGGPGPKLREGDGQVPEGIYEVENLNPNSSFYLSIRVNYPNREDRKLAAAEKRARLGGDIYIHGNAVSIGCIALGDAAIEEVFVMAALAKRPIPILIAPRDFRAAPPTPNDSAAGPRWLKVRYEALAAALDAFKAQPPP